MDKLNELKAKYEKEKLFIDAKLAVIDELIAELKNDEEVIVKEPEPVQEPEVAVTDIPSVYKEY